MVGGHGMIGPGSNGHDRGFGREHLVVRYFSKIINVEKTTCLN